MNNIVKDGGSTLSTRYIKIQKGKMEAKVNRVLG